MKLILLGKIKYFANINEETNIKVIPKLDVSNDKEIKL